MAAVAMWTASSVMYVLRGGNQSSVVIGLSTSVETYEAVRGDLRHPLLPWEDADHPTGPSGVEADRVLFAQLPSAVRS